MPDDLNALRHIDGFQIGEDADILALSDPPHYIAYSDLRMGKEIVCWGRGDLASPQNRNVRLLC